MQPNNPTFLQTIETTTEKLKIIDVRNILHTKRRMCSFVNEVIRHVSISTSWKPTRNIWKEEKNTIFFDPYFMYEHGKKVIAY